jgi:hypothetical protein
VYGYVIGGSNAEYHKSLGIVLSFVFLVGGSVCFGWVMTVLLTQGKDRISYSCRTVMIIPRSCLFNAALLAWENVARVYNIED